MTDCRAPFEIAKELDRLDGMVRRSRSRWYSARRLRTAERRVGTLIKGGEQSPTYALEQFRPFLEQRAFGVVQPTGLLWHHRGATNAHTTVSALIRKPQ